MKTLIENFRRYVNEQGGEEKNICLDIVEDNESGVSGYETTFFLYEAVLFERLVQQLKKKNALGDRDEFDIDSFVYEFSKSSGALGMIAVSKTDVEGHGECMGAYEIKLSAIPKKYQGKGNSKLLYGIAQAYVYPHPLTSDRESVSNKADRVWKSIPNRGNQKQMPPEKKPYLGHFDDISNPETPTEKDDCLLQKKPELNKAYASNDYVSTMKTLVSKNKKFKAYLMKKYNIEGIDEFFNQLPIELFESAYNE